jgi:succinate dehydrogenase/fumarate reductase flavoprotein subunit
MPDQKSWARWINNSSESMNWLIDIMEGEGYETTLEIGFVDPDGVWDSKAAAHNFVPAGGGLFGAGSGQALVMEVLGQKILDQGGTIHWSTKAIYLERENNNTGRVTSVIATDPDGKYVRYVGNKAIILATGDFSQDKEMMAKYSNWSLPLLFPDVEINYDATFQFGGLFPGDGQKMGLWIGAAWQRMLPNAPQIDVIGAAPATQSQANHSGINLNAKGERFMNEDTIMSYAGVAYMKEPNGVYFVWDSAYAKWFPQWEGFGTTIPEDNGPQATSQEDTLAQWNGRADNGQGFFRGDTIEEVLNQLDGLDVQAALKTIERYNGFCEKGVDDDFHKHKNYLAPIKTGPFFASQTVANPGYFLCVCGGLRTNEFMQVCEEDDTPIEGLYNIGVMVGDMYGYDYNFSIPGHGLGALCNTFPYLLGRELAQS